jgi:hypothetical protein
MAAVLPASNHEPHELVREPGIVCALYHKVKTALRVP